MDDDVLEIEPIAHIRTPYPAKFGIPRQAGLVKEAQGEIVFEPKYRDPDALRGIEGFSHLWLIWGFSENEQSAFHPLVRPPRLGGNVKCGVFATRSPYRPNGLGLSVVELAGVEKTADRGSVLKVRGVDLMDETPIYDIKPYLPYADAHPDARGGFAPRDAGESLEVECPQALCELLGDDAPALRAVLARDPRPAYHDDPARVYELAYAGWNVRFTVAAGVLSVVEVTPHDVDAATST